jgi:hypothetical protein
MSVFLNSGAVMGTVPALVAMFEDIMATDEVKTYFSLRVTGDDTDTDTDADHDSRSYPCDHVVSFYDVIFIVLFSSPCVLNYPMTTCMIYLLFFSDPDNVDGNYLKDDQYLMTKYMSRNRALIAFDVRQDLFANFNINHLKNRRANIKRTCKKNSAPNAEVMQDCIMVYPKMLLDYHAFSFDENCSLSR